MVRFVPKPVVPRLTAPAALTDKEVPAVVAPRATTPLDDVTATEEPAEIVVVVTAPPACTARYAAVFDEATATAPRW